MFEPMIDHRVSRLERVVLALAATCCVLAWMLVWAISNRAPRAVEAANAAPVLRVKGLIIEDGEGRARILLGAPFPDVPSRQRHDTTTTSLVFLDEQGHDRVAIGEVMPAQIDGKVPAHFHRIGSAYGLTIFDPSGNERGGIGFLSNASGLSRAAVVLDRPGQDAIGMAVDDQTDSANLTLMYSPKVAPYATGMILGTEGRKASILLKDFQDTPRATFGIGPERKLSFQTYDEKGVPTTEMLPDNDAGQKH